MTKKKLAIVCAVCLAVATKSAMAQVVDPDPWDGTFTTIVTMMTDKYYVALAVILPFMATIGGVILAWKKGWGVMGLKKGRSL